MRYAVLLSLLLVCAGCGSNKVTDGTGTDTPKVEITAPMTAIIQGATEQLSATYYDDHGDAVSQTTFTWTSSTPAVATVATDGTVMAVTPGQTMIKAAARGVESDALTLSVHSNQVAAVGVAPATALLAPGDTRVFTATAANSDGDPLPNASVTWATDDTDVATVNANGVVTAVADGTASLTATAGGVASSPVMLEVRSTRSSSFTPAGNHEATGTATLTRQANGDLLLSFDSGFSVTDQPEGLYVYLSSFAGVDTATDASYQVAQLTSTSGAQSYVIQNVGLFKYDYVAVYCVPNVVLFATAGLN
jgi:hypothetical protein